MLELCQNKKRKLQKEKKCDHKIKFLLSTMNKFKNENHFILLSDLFGICILITKQTNVCYFMI